MVEPARGLPAETYEHLHERGFGWNDWVDAFHHPPTWRMVHPLEGGWVASHRGRTISPSFPDPITAFVYAETCGWTEQENTL